MTTIYKLNNISQKNVTNPIKLELNTLGGNEYNILAAECLDISREILVHYDSSNTHNNKNIDVIKEDNMTTVAYNIDIPPESYVIYKTIFERTYNNDVVDAQITKIPVINADIIVNFPINYTFEIVPMMSIKPKLITESNIQKIYRVKGGILPYQGFMFYLKKDAVETT